MTALRLSFVVLAALLVDQGTKVLALAALAPGDPVQVLPGLALKLGFNKGASFGMLSSVMAGRPLAMIVLTAVITVLVAVLAFRSPRRLEATGLALIVGGSLGNIADRVRQGAVTDFIDVFWRDWRWPAFNIADLTISCGVGLILLAALKVAKERRENA
jgi:signal peptidase II